MVAVSREELKDHVKAVYRDGNYQCDLCDFAAVKMDELNNHV